MLQKLAVTVSFKYRGLHRVAPTLVRMGATQRGFIDRLGLESSSTEVVSAGSKDGTVTLWEEQVKQ